MDNWFEETLETYNETADWYDSKHKDPKTMKYSLDKFIVLVETNKVVDIGCGNGRDVKYLVENGLDVIGVDLSSQLLNIARKKVEEAKFINKDMRDLPFENSSFGGIWTCAAFHHLPKNEGEKALKEFYRILKPKGILFISVKKGVGERMVKKDYYQGNQKFFAYYSENELQEKLENIDFEILEIKENKDSGVSNSNWISIFAKKN